MLDLAILFLFLVSGSVFCLVSEKCTFEKMLPVTCASIIFILYFWGLFDHLKAGLFFVTALVLLLYAAFLLLSIRFIKRDGLSAYWSRLRKTILTVPTLIFVILFAVLFVGNYGRLVSEYDEFSHWGTVVKQMFLIDRLGGSKDAVFVYFRDYPPFMALFQYFVQKIGCLYSEHVSFCDWKLFFAYQILVYSFIFPVFSRFDYKKLSSYLLTWVVLFAPFLIYSSTLSTLYIDPFLGILSGVGMAYALLSSRERDFVFDLIVLFAIAALVLTKKAGALFSVFLAFTYFLLKTFSPGYKFKSKKTLLLVCGLLLCFAFPYLSWKTYLSANRATVTFSDKIDLIYLIKMFTGSVPFGYRKSILMNFIRFLIDDSSIQVLGVPFPFVFCFALLLTAQYAVLLSVQKWVDHRSRNIFLFMITAEMIVYVVGLLLTYMFKFSEYEASRLASGVRYMNIMVSSMFITVVLTYAFFLESHPFTHKTLIVALTVCAVFMTPQLNTFTCFCLRDHVRSSIRNQETYEPFFEEVVTKTEPESSIYFISQESNGYDFLMTQYNLMPRHFNHDQPNTWSLGGPFYPNDVWPYPITCDEWHDILLEDYDYVALMRINSYFCETYGSLFESPDSIEEGCVYKVDLASGKLIKL